MRHETAFYDILIYLTVYITFPAISFQKTILNFLGNKIEILHSLRVSLSYMKSFPTLFDFYPIKPRPETQQVTIFFANDHLYKTTPVANTRLGLGWARAGLGLGSGWTWAGPRLARARLGLGSGWGRVGLELGSGYAQARPRLARAGLGLGSGWARAGFGPCPGWLGLGLGWTRAGLGLGLGWARAGTKIIPVLKEIPRVVELSNFPILFQAPAC